MGSEQKTVWWWYQQEHPVRTVDFSVGERQNKLLLPGMGEGSRNPANRFVSA